MRTYPSPKRRPGMAFAEIAALTEVCLSQSCGARKPGYLCVRGALTGSMPELRRCSAGHPEFPTSWLLSGALPVSEGDQ